MVMIKKYNLLLAILICLPFAFTSCSDDDDVPASLIPASDKGVYTDERDGNEYQWVRYGNLEWMAENFRYDLRDEDYCRVYSGDSRTLDPKVYGRLYTYQGAVDACPEGWRLPTDEDWQCLEMAMGMSASDAGKKDAWRGNIAKRILSIYGTATDFNALLAGWYFPHTNMGLSGCRYYGVYAAFWTATQDQSEANGYYYRKFFYSNDGIFRSSTAPDMGFSVRYVRDAKE